MSFYLDMSENDVLHKLKKKTTTFKGVVFKHWSAEWEIHV